MNIPRFDLAGNGLPLHFLHANGYPPNCYKPLLELLQTQYHVFGMLLRPLWPDSKMDDIQSWHPFSDDLLHFLAGAATSLSASDRVIGVGHSIGGTVTLRAAIREPKQFRAIILLDPVLFVPTFTLLWNIVRAIGLGNKIHPLIPLSQKRRRIFDNLGTVFQSYRHRNIFRYMSDENLKAYIEGMTIQKEDGGFELLFAPEWESHIYLTGMQDFDIWRDLNQLKVSTLILRGAETDIFSEKAARLVKKKNNNIRIETLEKSTHILPLERPREVFNLMQSFLKEV